MTLIYEHMVRFNLAPLLQAPEASGIIAPSVGSTAEFFDSDIPNSSPLSFNLSHPGGANPAVLLFATLKGETDSSGGNALTMAATYDSITMTEVASTGTNALGSVATVRAYLLQSPSTGENPFGLSFSVAQSIQVSALIGVNLVNVSGAGSGAVEVMNIADLDTDSQAITTGEDNSLIIGMIAVQGADAEPFTAGSGYTKHLEGNTGFSGSTDLSYMLQSKVLPSAGATVFDADWSTADGRSICAVEIEGITA